MTYLFIGGDEGISETINVGTVGVTTSTTYTYFNMNAEDWKHATIVYKTVSNNTLTLEGSVSPAQTSDANAVWTDVTSAMSGSASATTDGAWILDTPVPFTRMRVKTISSNASNSTVINIVRSR